ncbi:MAG: FHA domain-containing protein [Isosphaeraceae bacterium]|nr:FHA domain-containing protein [Isosphaeraceae bacterium]
MDYQLVIVRGRSAAQALQLTDGVTTVGRHDECQLRIKSSQVSRKHCELFEKKGLLLVKDLGSANGTFVNGQKVDGQRVLEPGDELMIGSVKLRVEKKSGATPAPAAVTAPAAKPSDTAVGAPATEAAPAPADDEFDIDFEGEPELAVEPAAAVTADVGGDSEFDALLNDPIPSSAPEAASKPTPAPATEPPPSVDKDLAEDAVADFLLDIKFDEDDR